MVGKKSKGEYCMKGKLYEIENFMSTNKVSWNLDMLIHGLSLQLSHCSRMSSCNRELMTKACSIYHLALSKKVFWPLVCRNRMTLTPSAPLLGAAVDQASLSLISVQRPRGHLGKLRVPLGRDRQSWMLGRPPPVPTTSNRKHRLTFNFSMGLSWWSPKCVSLLTKQVAFLAMALQPFHTETHPWILLHVHDFTQEPQFLSPGITF